MPTTFRPYQPVVNVASAFDRRCIREAGIALRSQMAQFAPSLRRASLAQHQSRCNAWSCHGLFMADHCFDAGLCGCTAFTCSANMTNVSASVVVSPAWAFAMITRPNPPSTRWSDYLLASQGRDIRTRSLQARPVV